MTTLHLRKSISRSPLRLAFLFIQLALFLALAGLAGTANAAIPSPTCPGPDCRKVITFYNNFTDHAVFPVIQAGIQNPDPWLQALFNNNSQSYAETHYSRVYVNPVHGIPPGGHVSVTVPWYSKLLNDPDTYADWYNGGRIVLFDTAEALRQARECRDRPPNPCNGEEPLRFTDDSPPISCNGCSEPLAFFKDRLAYGPKYPFQLVEYTFADVKTTVSPPSIIDLNVGYNVSYLDQVYLPVALAACGTEPCNSPDPFAVGYLGTTKELSDFRRILTEFSTTEGWPQYLPVPRIENNPRLPGAFDVFTDRVEVVENHQPSRLTPPGQSVTDLINQWNTCTSNQATRNNCPQYELYQQLDKYFKDNYSNYTLGTPQQCPRIPGQYPLPPHLTPLNIMPYVYGWVPFNRGCNSAKFNDLLTSPGPEARFDTTQDNYVLLQYNYIKTNSPKERFNPFTELIHAKDKLDANSYAFSIDDLRGYQNHPGEGLIIAIGGATGLQNTQPVKPDKPNYTKDFLVTLGNSIAQHRPSWKSVSVCGDPAELFPPLPPNPRLDTPKFIVDTLKYDISPTNPCTITVTDALDRKYEFNVNMKVPWPPHTSVPPPDPRVVTGIGRNMAWSRATSETVEGPPRSRPKFDLSTRDPYPTP